MGRDGQTRQQLNGYIQRPELLEGMEKYIVPSTWGNNAGIVGALALAKVAYTQRRLASA
jgi:fructokinase